MSARDGCCVIVGVMRLGVRVGNVGSLVLVRAVCWGSVGIGEVYVLGRTGAGVAWVLRSLVLWKCGTDKALGWGGLFLGRCGCQEAWCLLGRAEAGGSMSAG